MSEPNTSEHFLKQISTLSGESANHRRKARTYRDERDKLAKELEQLRTEHASVATERDSLKQKLTAAPSELQAQLEKLQGEVRTRNHKEAFAAVATELKVRPDALEDLWSLSGYKAETDTVDVEQIKGLVSTAVTARPYLIQSATETVATAPPAPKAGPGASRGIPDKSPAGYQVSKSQLSDPAWYHQNQSAVAEASRNGTLRMID